MVENFNGHILVEQVKVEQEQTTKFKENYIESDERIQFGQVVYGDDKYKTGSIVIFEKFLAFPVNIKGKKLLSVSSDSIRHGFIGK